MVVLDRDFRQLSAVVLAIRTNPSADKLDLNNVELVATDETTYQVAYSGAQHIGKDFWILFGVPQELAARQGLRLRMKKNAMIVPLPGKITSKTIAEIEQ